MKNLKNNLSGFTLIELVVTVGIVGILSTIILFSVTGYINRGKDSNIQGNLAILVPAGETYYNAYGNKYADGSNSFCDPAVSSVFKNTISQMPRQSEGVLCYGGISDESNTWTATSNPAGVCCYVSADGNSWVACAKEFSTATGAFCVDSRGVKEEIDSSKCNEANLTHVSGSITSMQCPEF
jgi:prepilin-type N-terminal cleavage/methylation domain-containing protein